MYQYDRGDPKEMRTEFGPWLVAWSRCTQVVFLFYVVALLLPVVVIVCTLPLEQVPNSIMSLAIVSVLVGIATPILISLFGPHRLQLVGSDQLHIYSFSRICLSSITIGEVSAVRRINFREYMRSRVRGWPTDWSRAVAIHLFDSSCVVVSVVDPEAFISDIKSI